LRHPWYFLTALRVRIWLLEGLKSSKLFGVSYKNWISKILLTGTAISKFIVLREIEFICLTMSDDQIRSLEKNIIHTLGNSIPKIFYLQQQRFLNTLLELILLNRCLLISHNHNFVEHEIYNSSLLSCLWNRSMSIDMTID